MEENENQTTCRLCLKEQGSLTNVFSSEVNQGWTPAEVIEELLRLEVSSEDIYPQGICRECLEKLQDFKRFKDRCVTCNDLLQIEYYAKRVSASDGGLEGEDHAEVVPGSCASVSGEHGIQFIEGEPYGDEDISLCLASEDMDSGETALSMKEGIVQGSYGCYDSDDENFIYSSDSEVEEENFEVSKKRSPEAGEPKDVICIDFYGNDSYYENVSCSSDSEVAMESDLIQDSTEKKSTAAGERNTNLIEQRENSEDEMRSSVAMDGGILSETSDVVVGTDDPVLKCKDSKRKSTTSNDKDYGKLKRISDARVSLDNPPKERNVTHQRPEEVNKVDAASGSNGENFRHSSDAEVGLYSRAVNSAVRKSTKT